jgi:hypothetical protein
VKYQNNATIVNKSMSYENKPDIWPERDRELEREEIGKLIDHPTFKELARARWYPLPFFRKKGLTRSVIDKEVLSIQELLPPGERLTLTDQIEVISTGNVVYSKDWRSFFVSVRMPDNTIKAYNLNKVEDRHLPDHLKSKYIYG